MIHDLKCHPPDFVALVAGTKTHEARRADRPFAVGDILCLREWTPANPAACDWQATGLPGSYTGRTLDVEVTHLTAGPTYGLPSDLAVMSVRRRPAGVREELARAATRSPMPTPRSPLRWSSGSPASTLVWPNTTRRGRCLARRGGGGRGLGWIRWWGARRRRCGPRRRREPRDPPAAPPRSGRRPRRHRRCLSRRRAPGPAASPDRLRSSPWVIETIPDMPERVPGGSPFSAQRAAPLSSGSSRTLAASARAPVRAAATCRSASGRRSIRAAPVGSGRAPSHTTDTVGSP